MCGPANKQNLNIRHLEGPKGRQQAFVILRRSAREQRQHACFRKQHHRVLYMRSASKD